MKFNPYSFTRMSMYNQCKRKFKYRYLDKIIDRSTSFHLEKGKYVHEVLENLYTGEKVDKSKYDLTDEQYKEIDVMIVKFIKSEFSTKFIKQQETQMNEVMIAIDMNLQVGTYDYRDKGLLYLGSIDRINIYNDTLHLIDWKTGKPKNDTEQLRHYAMWAFTQFPDMEKVVASYVFVEHNQSKDEIIYKKDVKDIQMGLLYNIKEIETDEEFPRNETPLCDYCEYGPNKLQVCDL